MKNEIGLYCYITAEKILKKDLRRRKLKLCRNVQNISLYKNDSFWRCLLCAFIAMVTLSYSLIMGKVKVGFIAISLEIF